MTATLWNRRENRYKYPYILCTRMTLKWQQPFCIQRNTIQQNMAICFALLWCHQQDNQWSSWQSVSADHTSLGSNMEYTTACRASIILWFTTLLWCTFSKQLCGSVVYFGYSSQWWQVSSIKLLHTALCYVHGYITWIANVEMCNKVCIKYPTTPY